MTRIVGEPRLFKPSLSVSFRVFRKALKNPNRRREPRTG
jgi:hypothetical protein